jgi:hypothetical protein
MRFVNILGADAKPFGKQEYWFFFHVNLKYFWSSSAIDTEK